MARRATTIPWGTTAALLTASFATLVGVVCDVEPHVILLRASVSAVGIGAIVSVCAMLLGRDTRGRLGQRRRPRVER